jgi:sugar O-acyltransferase (sialic acid O-acetyltransferase NeuD family)
MIISEILVPLLNANEPEARVVTIHADDGQTVEAGALLFTIETTKTASDIESPQKGVFRLLVKEGETLAVGDKLAVLTETADEPYLKALKNDAQTSTTSNSVISFELRITNPARKLAELLGVNLDELPSDQLITESVVRQLAGKEELPSIDFSAKGKEYLVIFGGGGHAKTVIDMVKKLGEHPIAGIIDDDKALSGKEILGIPVLGTRALLPTLKERGVSLAVNCVGGILDINVRVRIFELLKETGFSFPVLVHPRASVEPSAKIGDGVQVFANAYIGSEAVLHPKCMVNTNAVISHDCVIGEHTHVAPGALLAGHVDVGRSTLIGMGVTTAIGVKIGSYVRIGNGAIVLADVPDHSIIQAGRYWVGKAQ